MLQGYVTVKTIEYKTVCKLADIYFHMYHRSVLS